MNLEEMLGIDASNPRQQHAIRQVEADWRLIQQLVQSRIDAGMTQEQVAHGMGISQAAVARIESGTRDPRLSTLRRYAIAVGAMVSHDVQPVRRRPAYIEALEERSNAAYETGRWLQSSRSALAGQLIGRSI